MFSFSLIIRQVRLTIGKTTVGFLAASDKKLNRCRRSKLAFLLVCNLSETAIGILHYRIAGWLKVHENVTKRGEITLRGQWPKQVFTKTRSKNSGWNNLLQKNTFGKQWLKQFVTKTLRNNNHWNNLLQTFWNNNDWNKVSLKDAEKLMTETYSH